MRELLTRYHVVFIAFAAGAAYILWEFRDIAAAFFAAYVLAAALLPPTDFGSRYIPRVIAVLLIYLLLIGIVIGIFFPAITSATGQFSNLSGQFDSLVETISAKIPFVGSINPTELLGGNGPGQAVAVASNLFSSLALAVASFVMSVYFVYDWHRIHEWLASFFPDRARASRAIRDAEETLGSWVRGQLLLSLMVGVLVFIATFAYGLAFSPLLAIMAAFFEIIPYAGPIIAAAPAVILALGSSLTSALIVAGIYTVIQQIEGHILVPLVMKNSVRLHPIAVILSILVGFEVLGIVGALLAVPFTSIMRVIVHHVYTP